MNSYPSQTTKPHIRTENVCENISNCSSTFLDELWIRNDFAPVQNDDRASNARSPLAPHFYQGALKAKWSHKVMLSYLYAPC